MSPHKTNVESHYQTKSPKDQHSLSTPWLQSVNVEISKASWESSLEASTTRMSTVGLTRMKTKTTFKDTRLTGVKARATATMMATMNKAATIRITMEVCKQCFQRRFLPKRWELGAPYVSPPHLAMHCRELPVTDSVQMNITYLTQKTLHLSTSHRQPQFTLSSRSHQDRIRCTRSRESDQKMISAAEDQSSISACSLASHFTLTLVPLSQPNVASTSQSSNIVQW